MKRFCQPFDEISCIQRKARQQIEFTSPSRTPSRRLAIAIGAIGFSYITCWPLIALLGAIALKLNHPLIFSIGSPTAYVFSHLLFAAGIIIGGSDGVAYLKAFICRSRSALFRRFNFR